MTASLLYAGSGFDIDPDVFNTARAAYFGAAGATRRDARQGGGWQLPPSLQAGLNRVRLDANSRIIGATLRQDALGRRSDGFSASAGYHQATDLEYVLTGVLEEQYPIPTSMMLFPVSTEVPVGAETFAIEKEYRHGQARFYGGGDLGQVPMLGRTKRKETREVRHIVAGHAYNIWEAQADRFANRNRQANLMRDSRDAILFLANRAFWGLDNIAQDHNIYGVLSYPWLPKKDIQSGGSKATIANDPDTALQELHDLVDFPHQSSKSVFYPDTLVMTNRLYDALAKTRLVSNDTTTILEQFMRNTKHIKRIEIAWELEDAGGEGIDGILAYRSDQQGIELVMPQGVTMLPVIDMGLEKKVVNYASIGGVLMRNPKNNVLGFWDTTA